MKARNARLLLVAALALITSSGVAQDDKDDDQPVEPEPLRLIEREPFDRIRLDERNLNKVYEIVQIKVPGGRDRVTGKPAGAKGLLIFAEFENPALRYTVPWENVVEFKKFQDLLREEADRLSDAQNFDEAYEYFLFLYQHYPATPELKKALLEHLYKDAGRLYAEGEKLRNEGKLVDAQRRYQSALSVIEELHMRDANYRLNPSAQTLMQVLDKILDRLLGSFIELKQFGNARTMMARIATAFRDQQQPVIERHRARLRALAADSATAAREALDKEDGREAHRLVRQMLYVYPQAEGGPQLAADIMRKFPLVMVGVMEPALRCDPNSLDNWGTLRAGRLTNRMLLEYVARGPEGGTYESPLGAFELGDGGTQLIFELFDPETRRNAPKANAYSIARRMLDLADPLHRDYRPSWAQVMSEVEVKDARTVVVHLRFPHVLPETFLQLPLEPVSDEPVDKLEADGPYALTKRGNNEITFATNPRYDTGDGGRRPKIVERHFKDATKAVSALLSGEIDVLDGVLPLDIARLKAHPDVKVGVYELPTTHMLVPNTDNKLLASAMFRRAMAFGLNRKMILEQMLLGNQKVEGCRVLSGPFPAGVSDSDALAYAYDEKVVARPYSPRLGLVQLESARQLLLKPEKTKLAPFKTAFEDAQENLRPGDPDYIAAEKAYQKAQAEYDKFEQEIKEAMTLTLAHPAGEIPTIACQQIARQWKALDIDIVLKPLPPGQTSLPKDDYDLLYLEVTMWEPLVDAQRLLGMDGIAPSSSSYSLSALSLLDHATSWGQARRQLYELHTRAFGEMSVIPLWQTIRHFAHRNGLRGIGSKPLTLYQNVTQWQNLETAVKQ